MQNFENQNAENQNAGHSYEHLKKIVFMMKIDPVACILNVCVYNEFLNWWKKRQIYLLSFLAKPV